MLSESDPLVAIRPSSWTVLLLLSLITALPTVYGTQAPRLTFEELTAGADRIVHGEVTRCWSAWDATGQSIWTHCEIRVEETLKGAVEARLVVSEPGGEVDGVEMAIAGAPRYEAGEEVVVFAAGTPIGYLRTCGWGQGRFVARQGPGGKQVRSGLGSVAAVPGRLMGSGERAAVSTPDLNGLKERIRAEVGEVAAR